MTNVGSLSSAGQSVFDYETQSGITHLLASIRASKLSSAQKNDLRDLVFLYSNGGRDKRVLVNLVQKISEYNLPAVPKKSSPTPTQSERPTIGKFRSAPIFKANTEVSPKEEVASVVDFKSDETWKKTHNETVAAAPQPVSEQADIEKSAPVVDVPKEVPVQDVPVSEPKSVATPSENKAPVVPADTQAEALERIRQIKALVNEKVGNPVNLVDIDNTVGREYMGALLDAMKKINTGSSAGSAMARLETAYVAVEKTLENRGQNSPPEPKKNPTSIPVAPVPEPVKIDTVEPNAPPTVRAVPEPVIVKVKTPTPVQEEVAEPVQPSPVNRVPIQNISREANISTPEPVVISSSRKVVEPHVAETVSRWGAEQEKNDTNQSENPVAASGIKPLASLADLSHPTSQPEKAVEVKSAVSVDPLYTPEIDSGLDQLLGEWQIFKKSGIFGTGPNGREHPLFKKMASLQIPLLLAGRFEGATQEIKQSVTDYMNGWRYEQGLIYEQGELFEHYLRRVIKHILDLQKSKM